MGEGVRVGEGVPVGKTTDRKLWLGTAVGVEVEDGFGWDGLLAQAASSNARRPVSIRLLSIPIL